MVLLRVKEYGRKMNFRTRRMHALAERCVGLKASLAVIIGIDFCVSQDIALISEALRRRTFFRGIGHQVAFHPLTVELLSKLGWNLCEQTQMRNFAIIGKSPK